ncbi:flotillin-2 isoform X1 [Corapipo altera]|nr:flotillin-2 isoform X1 [Corapipo altera]
MLGSTSFCAIFLSLRLIGLSHWPLTASAAGWSWSRVRQYRSSTLDCWMEALIPCQLSPLPLMGMTFEEAPSVAVPCLKSCKHAERKLLNPCFFCAAFAVEVKIMTEKELLAVACEQFLGKNVQDVKNVVLQTLEGHLRSILGTLTVEQIYQDRDQFAKLVREVAAPDVGRMGIEILSFTIKDVYDKVDYLSSLGKTQIAAVQRDADIGVAEAERDAGIREAECKKEMMDVKFMADTKIADSKRAFELQKAAFTEEVNIKTAEAQLAYELQSAREQQKIRQEEIEIEVVQRKKQIDVEEKEVIRMEKELMATVRQPAEAEAYRIQQIAEGEKVKQILLAQAEAEKIRKIGEAEAFVIEAMGMAEAEGLKLKAEALQQYGEAARLALVLDALPEIAAKVSAPLSKVDEIVILSGDNNNTMSEVNRLLAEIPTSVRALTGVDLTKLPLFQKATVAKE